MSNEGFKEDFQNEMTFAAFNAWQIIETLKGMLGRKGKSTSFNEYAKALGLYESNEKPQNKFKNKAALEFEKNKALDNAAKIVHLFKKGREIKT